MNAIRDGENVNALMDGETLTFAPSGLTIVYGDNGSGKSGYARVLKAVTRTRASEQVRNDIFRERDLIPAATIDYSAGANETSAPWRSGEQAADDLSQLSFFDRACCDVYISRETEAAFRPFGLGLFDELVPVCERVRAEIERRSADLGRRTPGLPALDETTAAGSFLQKITGRTADQAVNEATSFAAADAKRLATLEKTEEQLKRGDPRPEAQRLERAAERIDRLGRKLNGVAQMFSRATWDRLMELREKRDTVVSAARLAREEAFATAPLDGVGDAVWRELWNAARAYSQTAYPGREFPVVDEALCVLCQQPLGHEAVERLRRFEEFVRDTTQQAAQDAIQALEKALHEVADAVVDDVPDDLLAEVNDENPELSERIAAYLQNAREAQAALRGIADAHATAEAGVAPVFPASPTEEIARVAEALRERARELVRGADPSGAAEARAELAELRARKDLADARDSVVKERDRLRAVAKLTAARSGCATRGITEKSAELTEKALTEVLVDRFTRETEKLGVEHVTLRTVGGRRGVLRYRAGFIGAAQDAPLPEVLSEGEQTALGLAGFLAEVWTDASKSGVILDDPVSSLDHERRDKVAGRLVALAGERQTVVFTHDVAFLLALKKHAVTNSVPVTERSVERLSAKPGHCQDFHKFSAKLAKEQIGELEQELAALRREREPLSAEQYRDRTAAWYKRLRRAWERAIEETLVGGVLTRDNLQVHPKMARTLILFTPEDNRQLQHGYSRATELSEVHDESPLINSPAPSLDDLAEDLQLLRDWHKRIAARTNLSDEAIYRLADSSTTAEAGTT